MEVQSNESPSAAPRSDAEGSDGAKPLIDGVHEASDGRKEPVHDAGTTGAGDAGASTATSPAARPIVPPEPAGNPKKIYWDEDHGKPDAHSLKNELRGKGGGRIQGKATGKVLCGRGEGGTEVRRRRMGAGVGEMGLCAIRAFVLACVRTSSGWKSGHLGIGFRGPSQTTKSNLHWL